LYGIGRALHFLQLRQVDVGEEKAVDALGPDRRLGVAALEAILREIGIVVGADRHDRIGRHHTIGRVEHRPA
jgi:hypothetical protein